MVANLLLSVPYEEVWFSITLGRYQGADWQFRYKLEEFELSQAYLFFWLVISA